MNHFQNGRMKAEQEIQNTISKIKNVEDNLDAVIKQLMAEENLILRQKPEQSDARAFQKWKQKYEAIVEEVTQAIEEKRNKKK